jgi:hypothetical protein
MRVEPEKRALLPRGPVRVGLAGALLLMLCLGTLYVLASPPFVSYDESAHAGYALDVTEGRIPSVRETVQVELPGQKPTRQFVAQHPPLYYVIVGPILAVGRDHGHPIAAIRVARLFSVALGLGVVTLAAVLAGIVLRRRRTECMVIAAGLCACVPAYLGTASVIHNDLLAVATAVLAYTGAAAALADRPRPWNVAAVCIGSGLTMATRLSSIGPVALACAALGLAVLLRTDGPLGRRLVRAAGIGLLPIGVAAVTAGWFFQRNKRLYDDYTGMSYGWTVLKRADNYTPLSYLTSTKSLPDLLTRGEGGGPWANPQWFGWWDQKLLALLLVVIAASASVELGRFARRLGAQRPSTLLRDRDKLARIALWGLLLALPITAWLQLAFYVAETGTPNPRYLFAVLPAVAVVVAAAMRGFKGRWASVLAVTTISFQTYLVLMTGGRWLNDRLQLPRVHPLRQWERSLDAAGIPAPALVLTVLLLGCAVGIALQAKALWSAAGRSAAVEGQAQASSASAGRAELAPVGS